MRPGGCGRERARWCDDVVGRCPSRTQEEPLSRDGAVSVTDGRDRSLTHTHTHRLTVTPTRQEATHARREACTPLRSVLSDALQTTSASMGRSAGSQPPIVTARPMFSLRLHGPGRSASFNPEQQSGAQLPILSPKARSSPRSVPKGPIPLPDRSTPPSRTLLSASREGFLTGKRIALSQKRVSRSSPETLQEPSFGSRAVFALPQEAPGIARGRQIVVRGRQLVPRGRQFYLQRAPRSPP